LRRHGRRDTLDAAHAAAARLDDAIARVLGRVAPAVQRALLDVVPGAELEAPPAVPRAL
jgi:hypothetical protein